MTQTADSELHARYATLLAEVARGAHADHIADARAVHVSGMERPWTDTGMDLAQGERFSVLAEGRLVLSEELDVWFPPRLYLWRRIGEKGPIFKAARDTATHTAQSGGRLTLAVARPWKSLEGDYEGSELPEGELPGTPGGYDALLIRWQPGADVAEGLRALLEHAPGDALLAAELERLAEPPVATPPGWEYLWHLGESDIFSEQSEGPDAPFIRGRPNRDAGILRKPVSLELRDDTTLRWRWRYRELPSELPEDQVPTHDYLSLALEFDNGQDLTWYWSGAIPSETSYRCPLPWWDQRETHLVIRSGPEGLGEWHAEERRVADDYRKAIGEPPARIVAAWLIAVNVFRRRDGEADFADIEIANGSERIRVS